MLLSFLLIILSTYLLASVFGSFAYFFVTIIGLIILNIEILSLFGLICPFGIITLNIITLAIISAFWAKNKKPLLKPDFTAIKANAKRILNCLKLDKGLLILSLGAIFLMAISFILSAFLPVNEPDALTYHTYRALIWAQKGFIHHFQTIDSRNLVMPINSEIIYTWIFSLTKKDIGFGLVQYITSFFTISGLWMILERLKFSFRKRLWTIFIFLSFAGVVSQISSTQTDLLVGTLLLYTIIFYLDYINDGKNWDSPKNPDEFSLKKNVAVGYFSSLSFAIALGVKSTAFIAGFPLLIFFFLYSLKKKTGKKFLYFFIALGINFIIFSSYNYILNFIDYSNPFGAQISVNRHSFFGGIKAFFANFIRYNIQLFDFSGFTWGIYLSEQALNIQNNILSAFNISPNTGVITEMEGLNSSLTEQTLGYGVTSILVFIPALLINLFQAFKIAKNSIQKKVVKERRLILCVLGLLFYINLIMLSLAIGYMVYSIRFICTFVIISAPVIALLYFKKNNFYKTLVILFCMFYLFIASLYLASRPFLNLVKSYNLSNSKEEFIQDVRCMKYDYFKRKKKSCEIDKNILGQIEEYKTVGIFPDTYVMTQLTKLNAAKKHIKLEELVLTRIDKYKLENYDYILTPEPFQVVTDFNNKDKKEFIKYQNKKGCFHFANDGKTGRLIQDEKDLKELYTIKCITPEFYLQDKGFDMLYKIQTKWNDVSTGEETISKFVLWKNNR